MKKNINIKLLCLYIILLPVITYGKEAIHDEFIIGRIEFTGKNGSEGIVVMNAPGKSYLLNSGVFLKIKRGDQHLLLKVTDADGKYLRCVLNGEAGAAQIKEGEDAYYADSINNTMKYRDAKKILSRLIKLYENFILKIESTEDTRVISGAVTDFSAELDKLIPEMKRINSKYPELEKFNVSPPDELRDESAKIEVLEPRLKETFFKINMFSSDEEVKKATEILQKVLLKMNPVK